MNESSGIRHDPQGKMGLTRIETFFIKPHKLPKDPTNLMGRVLSIALSVFVLILTLGTVHSIMLYRISKKTRESMNGTDEKTEKFVTQQGVMSDSKKNISQKSEVKEEPKREVKKYDSEKKEGVDIQVSNEITFETSSEDNETPSETQAIKDNDTLPSNETVSESIEAQESSPNSAISDNEELAKLLSQENPEVSSVLKLVNEKKKGQVNEKKKGQVSNEITFETSSEDNETPSETQAIKDNDTLPPNETVSENIEAQESSPNSAISDNEELAKLLSQENPEVSSVLKLVNEKKKGQVNEKKKGQVSNEITFETSSEDNETPTIPAGTQESKVLRAKKGHSETSSEGTFENQGEFNKKTDQKPTNNAHSNHSKLKGCNLAGIADETPSETQAIKDNDTLPSNETVSENIEAQESSPNSAISDNEELAKLLSQENPEVSSVLKLVNEKLDDLGGFLQNLRKNNENDIGQFKELEDVQLMFNVLRDALKNHSKENFNVLFKKMDSLQDQILESREYLSERIIKSEMGSDSTVWSIDKFYILDGALKSKNILIKLNIDKSSLKKLDELKEMATYGINMYTNGFTEEFIIELIEARMALRKSNVMENLPKKVDLFGTSWWHLGQIKSSNETEYSSSMAGFRGKDSITERLFNHIEAQGGDANFITSWAKQQRENSYSDYTLAVQDFLLNNMRDVQSFKDHPGLGHIIKKRLFFKEDIIDNKNQINEPKLKELRTLLNAKAQIALKIWLAMQIEVLTQMEIPGSDKEKRTVTIYRTENASYMPLNNAREGSSMYIKRAVLTSGSIGGPVAVVAGPEITEQKIPFENIAMIYFFAESKNNNEKALLVDDQREFLFMGARIRFEYKGKTKPSELDFYNEVKKNESTTPPPSW